MSQNSANSRVIAAVGEGESAAAVKSMSASGTSQSLLTEPDAPMLDLAPKRTFWACPLAKQISVTKWLENGEPMALADQSRKAQKDRSNSASRRCSAYPKNRHVSNTRSKIGYIGPI